MNDKYRNWKIGDKVICIQSLGHINNLTLYKEYEIINYFNFYGVEEVEIIGDCYPIVVFASRFIPKRKYFNKKRKEKLKKINKI